MSMTRMIMSMGMDARARRAFREYLAARARGAPFVEGPRVSDTASMVREATPYYISAAFVKIF